MLPITIYNAFKTQNSIGVVGWTAGVGVFGLFPTFKVFPRKFKKWRRKQVNWVRKWVESIPGNLGHLDYQPGWLERAAAAAAAPMAMFRRRLDQILAKSVPFSSLFLLFQRTQAPCILNLEEELNLILFVISPIRGLT